MDTLHTILSVLDAAQRLQTRVVKDTQSLSRLDDRSHVVMLKVVELSHKRTN